MLRRKRVPEPLLPSLRALRAVVEHTERAKQALTDAVPSSRAPGRPLASALLEFEDELREARRGMVAWRTREVDEEWRACEEALGEALAMAETLRLEAEPRVGFEALIGTIGDLLAPLEAFNQAAERFRALRR